MTKKKTRVYVNKHRDAQVVQMQKRGFITAAAAAEIAGVARVTIYYWLNTGKVRAVKKGEARYVDRQSLREYLKTG